MSERGAEVQSVARAIDLLEVLADTDGLGLTEIAHRAGLRHNTAHRLLATLISRGYVRREPGGGRYVLGYGVARLASRLGRLDQQLRSAAQPLLERVHKVCRETTNLVILDGADIVYVDQVAGAGTVRMFAEPGARVPAHASGAGKAMLAQLDRADVEGRLGETLPAFTDRTITSRARLQEELETIRVRGYALDREEYELAVSCVAAAIVGPDGRVAGALSVSGPTGRLGELADYAELGELVGRSALDVSRALGYEGDSPFRPVI